MNTGRMRDIGQVDTPAFTNVTYQLNKVKDGRSEPTGPEFKALVNCLVYISHAYALTDGMKVEQLIQGESVQVQDFDLYLEKRFSVG